MSSSGSPKAEQKLGIHTRFLLQSHLPSTFLCPDQLLPLSFSCKVIGGPSSPISLRQWSQNLPCKRDTSFQASLSKACRWLPLVVVGDGCSGNGVGWWGCGQEGGTNSTNKLTICCAVPLAERLSPLSLHFFCIK